MEPPVRDVVCRRDDAVGIGADNVASPISRTAAATAAALAEPLFLRVTRCVGISEPADMECEWWREWLLRAGKLEPRAEDIESRCWPRGRAGC